MPSECERSSSDRIPHRFAELSVAGRVLVATMRSVQYGRFEALRICNGDPTFDPRPRLVKVARIGSTKEQEMSEASDWTLKAPIRDLFREFAQLQNGTIDRLEFRRGIPCLVEMEVAALSDEAPETHTRRQGDS